MKMSVLEEKLRQKSLKITPQRLEILRAVQQLSQHPSAELVFQAVKKRYPAVSLATVYKTLDTLVEIGEIKVAMVCQGRTLYDTRLEQHHHAVCSECGYVEDIEMARNCFESCFPSLMRGKFRVDATELIFHGVCLACEDKKNNAEATQ